MIKSGNSVILPANSSFYVSFDAVGQTADAAGIIIIGAYLDGNLLPQSRVSARSANLSGNPSLGTNFLVITGANNQTLNMRLIDAGPNQTPVLWNAHLSVIQIN